MPANIKHSPAPRTVLICGCRIVVLGLLLSTSLLFVAACKSGGNSIHVKSPATGERDLANRSGYAFAVTKTFTDLNGKMTTASILRTYAANYDLDSGNFAMTLDKPLAGEDHIRVTFGLVGPEGTNDKSPPQTGTYSAKADKFMKVEDVAIVSRKGGTDNKSSFDRSTLTGEVKVSSASADEISGDIDLSAGETSIRGPFTAKILKRK